MSVSDLKAMLPEYAKDLKLNITNVLTSTVLNEQQIWGAALASALASRNAVVIRAIDAEAKQKLSPDAYTAAKAASAIMGMNNIYYRFAHLSGNEDYLKLPARLRMNIIGRPGVDKLDFELWSLAVSAINGCGMCIESHEKQVAAGGISKEGIQDAVRIAAVMHGVAATLDGEAALTE
ncbi:carboxymuconolactone decarboxylase family protein [Kiloniella laminariae]|uniref:Alkyl hydroperoxide reductase AhpD n=1 Tax=Kiloniella laminariae TaxID=454162 RepID=A0ABT4LLC8_9PROT|nr:carboxymuconolactone decarboxylase family protein [Kiloniella laminariae]MCZ4281886.1 carboxymuconolactone decarboxylase family protein [Kiloniella laminariae]